MIGLLTTTERGGMANVYIFNTYPTEGVGLWLNGPAGSLAAASSTNYVPTSMSIPRSPANGSSGTQAFGASETLGVAYTGGGATYEYAITGIGYSEVPEEDDLQLYLFLNLAILVKQSDAAPVPIQGKPASADILAGLEGVEGSQ
jgi:hypothetical protein